MFASLAVKCVAECAGKPNFNLGDLLAAEAHKHSVALGRKMSSQQITCISNTHSYRRNSPCGSNCIMGGTSGGSPLAPITPGASLSQGYVHGTQVDFAYIEKHLFLSGLAKSLKKTTGFLADCNVFVCLAGAVGVYKKAADTINQLQGRERKATRVAAKKH
ncbi:hypothetical protein QJQ45_004502 [Haematococcus lacustris]|nr:hypothetical protein QJQ45_004502 [Haematococcus lacustris]